MSNLFTDQPSWCRAPVVPRNLSVLSSENARVLTFDPTDTYNRIGNLIDPYCRTQSLLTVNDCFPSIKRLCACGCGHSLTGRQTRYCSESCSDFCTRVAGIIRGHSSTVNLLVRRFDYCIHLKSSVCVRCDSDEETFVDHIVPVKLGGGGCWLSNYQLLCHQCHRIKTCQDFGWQKSK